MTVALPFSWSAAVNTSAALAVPPLTNIATGTVDQIVELKRNKNNKKNKIEDNQRVNRFNKSRDYSKRTN